MVCTVQKLHSIQGGYYTERIAEEEGYAHGEERNGHFLGEGARALGLLGADIIRKDTRLNDLFHCIDPTTKTQLRYFSETERVYKVGGKECIHKPVIGYDFTFSAPKSVSVLWALSDENRRMMIEACHKGAVAIAVAHLEGGGFSTREKYQETVLKNGEEKTVTKYRAISVSPIFAVFSHEVSRNQDPQLYDHVVLLSTGIRPDGRGGAIRLLAKVRKLLLE